MNLRSFPFLSYNCRVGGPWWWASRCLVREIHRLNHGRVQAESTTLQGLANVNISVPHDLFDIFHANGLEKADALLSPLFPSSTSNDCRSFCDLHVLGTSGTCWRVCHEVSHTIQLIFQVRSCLLNEMERVPWFCSSYKLVQRYAIRAVSWTVNQV